MNSAFWAQATVWVGIAGTVAVALTLVANAIATSASWRATNLARKEFIASHRPVLRFRDAVLSELAPDRFVEIEIAIVNVGDSVAVLQALQTGLFARRPMQINFLGRDENPVDKSPIDPGMQMTIKWVSSFHVPLDDQLNVISGVADLLFEMTILYKDGNGTTRRTGVMRALSLKNRHFRKLMSDDEYADEDFEN